MRECMRGLVWNAPQERPWRAACNSWLALLLGWACRRWPLPHSDQPSQRIGNCIQANPHTKVERTPSKLDLQCQPSRTFGSCSHFELRLICTNSYVFVQANPHTQLKLCSGQPSHTSLTKDEWTKGKLGPHDRPSREFRTPQIGTNTDQRFSLIAKAHTGN